MNQNELLLGAHVSVSGGVHHAWKNATDIGATCMQIFTANQRQWTAKPIEDDVCHMFQQERMNHNVQAVVSHNSYLINLCSPKEEVAVKSRRAFREEIERCQALGVEYMNFHPGSHLKEGEAWGLRRIAEELNPYHEMVKGHGPTLLLETTAGQGTNLGYRFEQLAEIMEQMDDNQYMGVCLDTCHVFAAGYDLRHEEGYESMMAEFERLIGLDRLRALHLNDSKFGLDTRKDRHAGIGEGEIGIDTFRFIVNDDRLRKVPLVLETPEGDEAYAREIRLLRSMVRGADHSLTV